MSEDRNLGVCEIPVYNRECLKNGGFKAAQCSIMRLVSMNYQWQHGEKVTMQLHLQVPEQLTNKNQQQLEALAFEGWAYRGYG